MNLPDFFFALQDPLSALDAHVGKAVFHNVLHNNLSGKTRILVTHALHFLPQVDYIYAIADGRIAERGTYAELTENDGEFSKFITEFGSKTADEEAKEEQDVTEVANEEKAGGRKEAVVGPAMMQAEERNTGAIRWDVYKVYLRAGKGTVILPVLFCSLILVQGTTVMGSYWFVHVFAFESIGKLIIFQACLLARDVRS